MATQYSISTQSVALVASTNKTLIEIPTGATAPYTVIGLEIGFSATAAGSCVLEWGTFATTGTGTTVTPLKYGMDQGPSAILGTVKINDTVEPGTFAAGTLPSILIALPGMYSILYPYARELYQPISTNRCIRVNSSVACNARLTLYIEQ